MNLLKFPILFIWSIYWFNFMEKSVPFCRVVRWRQVYAQPQYNKFACLFETALTWTHYAYTVLLFVSTWLATKPFLGVKVRQISRRNLLISSVIRVFLKWKVSLYRPLIALNTNVYYKTQNRQSFGLYVRKRLEVIYLDLLSEARTQDMNVRVGRSTCRNKCNVLLSPQNSAGTVPP